jgi:hypothetical protein
VPGLTNASEIPYVLNVTNDYVSILDVLAYLEHLPHFTEVAKIVLSADTVPGPDNTVIHTGRVLGNIHGVFFIRK